MKRKYPYKTKYGIFENENKIIIQDWNNFRVSINDYMNGTNEITPEEFEKIFFEVSKLCGDDYVIATIKNEYRVIKKSEYKEILLSNQTDEEKKQQKIYNINSEIDMLNDCLKNTDWYIIREKETKKAIPENIKKEREKAREQISKLRLEVDNLLNNDILKL